MPTTTRTAAQSKARVFKKKEKLTATSNTTRFKKQQQAVKNKTTPTKTPMKQQIETSVPAEQQNEISALSQTTSDNRMHIPDELETLLARKQTAVPFLDPIKQHLTCAKQVIDLSSVVADSPSSPSDTTQTTKRKRKNLLPTPTSGLTATQITDDGDAAEGDGDDKDSATPPSAKRCCKSDLKRCLRVGDWIENIRIPRRILEEKNGGKKLLAQFDGQNFVDYQTEKEYRSISDWIKQRMLDLGAISESSNISGWDYAVVHRDGRTTTLRLLVEETKQKMELMRTTMKEQRQNPSPLTPSICTGSSPHTSQQQKFLAPTVGLISNPNNGISNDVLLINRLQNARQQVSELESLLYAGRGLN